MKITVEFDNVELSNNKNNEIEEFTLEDIIYEELQKFELEANEERRALNICYNTLDINKLAIHGKRHSEIMRDIRLLQSVLCKYYDKQVNK